MMEIVIGIIAVIAGIIGIIGSIVPALPGPPLSWIGMLLLYFWGGTNGKGEEMSLAILLVMLGVTVLVSILDYVIPAYLTRVTGGSKYAERGATIGMIVRDDRGNIPLSPRNDTAFFPRSLSRGNILRPQAGWRSSEIRLRLVSRIPCRHGTQTHRMRDNDVLYHRVPVAFQNHNPLFFSKNPGRHSGNKVFGSRPEAMSPF